MRKDDDDFPNADILRIATMVTLTDKTFRDRWLMEITYFLTTGLPSPQLRTDEKKRLVIRSRNFFWSKGSCITKATMESGNAEYVRMRMKWCYPKLIVVRQEATMWAMLRHEKSGKQAYGGRLRKRMCMNIVNNKICVNPWRLQGCHIN